MTAPAKIKTFGPGYSEGVDLFVGLDQSYGAFGITVLGSDNSYLTTVAKFEGKGAERLSTIQAHVILTLKKASKVGTVKDVAMEGYAFGREFGVAQSGELGGAVKLALYSCENIGKGTSPIIVQPSTLKKYVTGRAVAKKNEILLHTFKKWGVEFPDDNAADSFGLAHIISGKAKLAYEKEIYNKLSEGESREN